MRVTGGGARGIRLKVPNRSAIRPAMDSLRERVFSSLGPLGEAARVLDLFAGTGAWGLEALSRGAAAAVFVERDRGALVCLKENLAAVNRSLGRQDQSGIVVGGDVLRWRPGPDQLFDLVFADPPFGDLPGILTPVFRVLSRLELPSTGLKLVLEVPGRVEPSAAGWELDRRIGKGADQPTCCVFRRSR